MNEIARLQSDNSELDLKITQLRDGMDALAASNTGEEFSALQSRWESDRQRIEKLETELAQQTRLSRTLQTAAEAMQARLLAAEASVTGLSSRELDAGGELDLDEVDYLLRLANERLKLFADPRAADDALEVADMMTSTPVTCLAEATVTEVARLMRDRSISSVLVMADGKLSGIVTVHDLTNKVLAEGLDGARPVGEVMTSGPRTIGPGATGLDALIEM